MHLKWKILHIIELNWSLPGKTDSPLFSGSRYKVFFHQKFMQSEMEFKEFEPRFKSAKTRFKLSTGLNLETFDTI